MPTIEVSNGELLDRVSILEIKIRELPEERVHLEKDLAGLRVQADTCFSVHAVLPLYERLLEVNHKIWIAMQWVYDHESEIDLDYVSHVTAIIEDNKLRAYLKREIDTITESHLFEFKSFFQGQR